MQVVVERINYQAGSVGANGALIFDAQTKGPLPLLLISPNWLGVSEAAIKRVSTMAGSKYIAFIADMYGDGKVSNGPPEAATLANGLRADAPERRRRITAALEALRDESTKRGIGDLSKQAAAGFCFGGGNVLELARTGADVKAVVCMHGDLITSMPAKKGDIKAAVCVMHGAADPAVPKKDRDTFETEMEAAGAKWQMTVFGHLLHSFTEEESNVPGIAQFDPGAARQCYNMVDDFVTAAFDNKL
ncbi:MAG TPA: dienelactone hydrolase family protein [Pseudolabrys sp.]|nr:dienelactone hydrolase family protein [Pseudolabrys sp.]